MPPPQARGGGGGMPSFLLPGLFVCLMLSLFVFTPGPFLFGGRGSSSSSGGGGGGGMEAGTGAHTNGGGSAGAGGGEMDLLLRGKQTQRAAGVPPHQQGKGPAGATAAAVAGQPASTEGLLRYFAEAHHKVGGILSSRVGMLNGLTDAVSRGSFYHGIIKQTQGMLSASALKEVELLVRSGGASASSPSASASTLPPLINPDCKCDDPNQHPSIVVSLRKNK